MVRCGMVNPSQVHQWADDERASGSLDDNRLLLDRVRLGLRLILAGVAFVFVGERLLHGAARPLVNVAQAVNFVVVAAVLVLLRGPTRRSVVMVAGFFAYVVTVICTGAVGVFANDAITPMVLFVGLAVVTATLVPWSPWWQLGSVVILIATAVWMVAAVVESPRLFWLQYVGTLTPTLFSTVLLCRMLQRQRLAVAHAERQRQSREESLREANQRLELEIQEHQRTEEALRFAMRELDHRVKNTLATVQAVADQTLQASPSMNEFAQAFSGRIRAMARIHTALANQRWEGLHVTELIELVVGPFRHHPDSVAIECDASFVSAELVRTLGMALHELATNAAKYGALSTTEGRVQVRSQGGSNGAAALSVSWRESGGPLVRAPVRRGFGTMLIEDAIAYEVGGSVRLEFPVQGLCCDIEIPMPAAFSGGLAE